MKLSMLLPCLGMLTLLSSCADSKKNSALPAESTFAVDTASIKLVIKSETDAFANRDSIKLYSYYADDLITQSAWNNPNGTYSKLNGIRSIKSNFYQAFKNNPDRIYLPDIQRTGWFFRKLSDEWMWVNFMQTMTLTDGKIYSNYETRLMKKVGGEWKIAVMIALGDHGHSPD